MKQNIDFHSLVTGFLKVQRIFQQQANKAAEICSTSSLQFEALTFIAENERCSMNQIATHLMISMPSASQLIDRLIESKFVTRIAGRKDRRHVYIEITPTGKFELKRAVIYMNEKVRELFSDLTDTELLVFKSLSEKVIKRVEENGE